MREDHLLNILKIISNDDFEENIIDTIYQYLESRKVLDVGYDSATNRIDLIEIDLLLKNTNLIKREDSPYEYEIVL